MRPRKSRKPTTDVPDSPSPAKKPKPSATPDTPRRSTRTKQQFVPFAGQTITTPTPQKAPIKKKIKSKPPTLKNKNKKQVNKGKNAKNRVAKGKVTKKVVRKEKVKKEKGPKKPRDKNSKLVARPGFNAKAQNYLYYDKGEITASTTPLEAVRLSHLYTVQKRFPELQKLLKNTKLFPVNGANVPYASGEPRSLIEVAASMGDKPFFEKVLKAVSSISENSLTRVNLSEESILKKVTSGRANIHMLGHATRAIEAGRGSRQGNNALILHDVSNHITHIDVAKIIANGGTFEMLEAFRSANMYQNLNNKVVDAVRVGNRKLAAQLIQAGASYCFNDLHSNTLTHEKGELPKFLPVSVSKKGLQNKNITPVHTAAINPNVDVLKAVLKVEYDPNVADSENWHTLHYAAVCEGSGPLSHLLGLKVSMTALNKQKESTLHAAARVGRLANVKLLIDAATKNDTATVFINAKNIKGLTPLHLAVENGHIDVVKYLLTVPNINADMPSVSTADKLTPLMTAAKKGYLNMVKLLIDEGKAFIDALDRFKRTPLIHAVLGGQDHIVVELLGRGASVTTRPDSSGNTAAHYAAAYNWRHILELLYQADPDSMVAKNAWHLSPMTVAYLKGHFDIADWFISTKFDGLSAEISVDDADIEGKTLLMHVVDTDGQFDAQTITAVKYLLEHKADLKIKNAQGQTAFYRFAGQATSFASRTFKTNQKLTEKQYLELASLLSSNFDASFITSECDDKKSPFDVALTAGNFVLLRKLLETNGDNIVQQWKQRDATKITLLHDFLNGTLKAATKFVSGNTDDKSVATTFEVCDPIGTLKLILEHLEKADLLKKYTETGDAKGVPPLILAVWNVRKLKKHDQNPVVDSNFAKARTVLVSMVEQLVIANPESVLLEVDDKKKVDPTDETTPVEPDDSDDDGNENDDADSKTSESEVNDVNDSQPTEPDSVTEAIGIDDDETVEIKEYSPNAFEYTLRHKDNDSTATFQLNENTSTFTVPSLLIEAVLKHVKKDRDLLKRVLTKVDRRFGFNGLTPFLFCLEVGLVNAAAYILFIAQQSDLNEYVLNAIWEGITHDYGKTVTRFQKHALLLVIEKRYYSLFNYIASTSTIAAKPDDKGRNALHYIAKNSDDVVERMQFLVARGISVIIDSFGRHPLHYATAAIQASRSVDVCPSNIDFFLATDSKSVSIVDSIGRTPLQCAFVGLHEKADDFHWSHVPTFDPIVIVLPLLKKMTRENIAQKDILGNTAIHYAAMAGAHVSLTQLLEHASDFDVPNAIGNTPVGYAVAQKHENVAMHFILLKTATGLFYPEIQKKKPVKQTGLKVWKVKSSKASDDKPKSENDVKPTSILELIVLNDWQAIVHVILNMLSDSYGQSSVIVDLIAAAVTTSRRNLLQVLLKRMSTAVHLNAVSGLDLKLEVSKRAFGVFGKTATKGDDAEVILRLLFEEKLIWNFTAAEELAERGEIDLLNVLHQHDSTQLVPKWPEFIKSESGNVVLVNLLNLWSESSSNANEKTKNFITKNYTWELLDGCLDFGAAINDGVSTTPLSYAVITKKILLVKYLVSECDVDRGIPDGNSVTPFMKAIHGNNVDVIRALIQKTEIPVDETNGIVESPVDFDDVGTLAQPTFGASFLQGKRKHSAPCQQPVKTIKTKTPLVFDTDFIIDNVSAAGYNAIHYLVKSAHENVALLSELFAARPKQIPDMILKATSAGTPYSMALKLRQTKLLTEFQRILKAAKVKNFNAYNNKIQPISFTTMIEAIPRPLGDVTADYSAFLESQKNRINKKPKEDPRKPYHLCENAATSEIVVDEDTGALFKAVMHKTDLFYGFTGLHNFYRVELVQRKRSELFVLFTNWGRIGDNVGQFQHTPFSDRESAVKEFKTVYRQKTGNDFGAEFIEKKDKYHLVDAPSEDQINLAEVDITLVKGVPERDAEPTYSLIRDVADIDLLKSKWKAVNATASCSIPFGRASREKLLKAKKLLSELQGLNAKYLQNNGTNRTPEEIIENLRKQYRLSSEFFMTLLLGDYAFEKLPVIDNDNLINKYSKVIDQFLEIENGALLVAAAAQRQPTIDPYRYILSALDSKIELIDEQGDFAQMVLQGVANQLSDVKVTGIFEILSRSPAQTFVNTSRQSNFNQYLWHGSRTENILSILKTGLVVTPSHAIWNGARFGEGIYMADTIAKAYSYSSFSNNSNCYVLICQVSVDTVQTLTDNTSLSRLQDRDVKNVDMVVAPGKEVPDPTDDVTTPEGIRFCRGPLIEQESEYSWFLPDRTEYVVKNRANVLPRYLVRFSS